MSEWKALLADVDDDYLVGIANKGIVKRAYKDKEEGNYQVLSVEEEGKVSVGGESVTIRFPLGESVCSCPSRSICRHTILGILALKEYVEKEIETEAEREVQGDEPAGQAEEEADKGQTEKSEETVKVQSEIPKENEPRQRLKEQIQKQEPFNVTEGKSGFQTKIMEEIAAYPFSSIQKVLGSKQLKAIIGQKEAGKVPKIRYSSVIMVDLPGQEHRVKLLSPLEYSACTCHKNGLCGHKAAALLWCKLEAGLLTPEELGRETLEKTEYDREQIREAAGQMKLFLEELLNTGLARMSPDVLDYMDRLAIISHNARLANFEGYWRALRDSYENYFKRKASFRIGSLMEQLARFYQRTGLLLEAENDRQISKLAGEFKAEYGLIGDLDLVGIAIEHFDSQTGYEGETVYFLEENTKEWYTYTFARPVFYEKSGRRGRPEKAQAPWGLPLSLEELAKSRIHLIDAKSDDRRRLSSSQDSKGEVVGEHKKGNPLYTEELGGWYYRDFEILFEEQIDKKKRPWLKGQEDDKEAVELVFLRPASCHKAFFSETEQKLFMSLYDEKEREVVIEVAYSKKESWGIRYLERVTNEKLPCFLGKVYLRNGRVRMYPVAAFEKGELEEDGI